MRTELEAPDDDEDNNEHGADDVEARVAEPVLDVLGLARRVADALVDRRVLAAVEERPDEVDADGDDEQRVHRHAVRVEAHGAVPLRAHSGEAVHRNHAVSVMRRLRGRWGDIPDDGDEREPGVGEGDEPQAELLVRAEIKQTSDYDTEISI